MILESKVLPLWLASWVEAVRALFEPAVGTATPVRSLN